MNKNATIKSSQQAIPTDPTITVNPDDPTLQQKRRKANEFAKAFPGMTTKTARNGANQPV